VPTDDLTADQLRGIVKMIEEGFRDAAPLDAAGAARIILDGVRAGRWRILVGDDAVRLDEQVRANPEGAYDHTEIGITPLSFEGPPPGD
jgi:hypothetical protein